MCYYVRDDPDGPANSGWDLISPSVAQFGLITLREGDWVSQDRQTKSHAGRQDAHRFARFEADVRLDARFDVCFVEVEQAGTMVPVVVCKTDEGVSAVRIWIRAGIRTIVATVSVGRTEGYPG